MNKEKLIFRLKILKPEAFYTGVFSISQYEALTDADMYLKSSQTPIRTACTIGVKMYPQSEI